MHSFLPLPPLALFMLLLAACAPRTPEQQPPSDASAAEDTSTAQAAFGLAPGDTVVTLKRTRCFGTCPVYSVALTAGGQVRYEGQRYVAVEGRAERQIAPDSVRQLVETLKAEGYFELRDYYVSGEVCNQQVSDLPTAITSARDGEQTKRVEHYHGCRWDGQKRLIALEDTIDAVAGTRRWVKGASRR